MAYLKHSKTAAGHVLRSLRANRWVVTLPKRGYAAGEMPEGYEYVHIGKDELVQPLDNTVPLTAEKRAKLAAKYNMRPEDYVPLNSKDYNYGDYPSLPLESAIARDPFYDWDDVFHRRNYGEPILHDLEMYQPTAADTTPHMFDRSQMWPVLLGFIGGFIVLYLIGHRFVYFPPRSPKEYPEYFPGDEKKHFSTYDHFEQRGLEPKYRERKAVTHYTFEEHKWNKDGYLEGEAHHH